MSFFEKLTELVACLLYLALAAPPPKHVAGCLGGAKASYHLYCMYHTTSTTLYGTSVSGTRHSSVTEHSTTSIVLGDVRDVRIHHQDHAVSLPRDCVGDTARAATADGRADLTHMRGVSQVRVLILACPRRLLAPHRT
jgi:hypothetical protein